MECVELDKYLLPVFAISLLTTLFAHWRMKANAVEGLENEIEKLSIWKKLMADLAIPRKLLTKKGIIWFRIGIVSNVVLALFYVSYLFFAQQDWVCPLGPSNG